MISLKARLANNQLTLGSWITLGHSGIAEIMAKSGFDWLTIDLEHSAISIQAAEELIRTIDLCGVAPLVRLTANDAKQIKRVMDAGAHGIIVPMVNSRAQAEEAIAATYYPPKGTRGVGLARAQGYGAGFANYKHWLEKQCTVIVQIEHIDAVNNAEAILSLPDVDGFIIGPYDLSASMGLIGEIHHPEVVKAITKVRKIAAQLGKPSGIHLVEPDTHRLRQTIAEGFRFIAYSVDIRMLDHACRAGFSAIKDVAFA